MLGAGRVGRVQNLDSFLIPLCHPDLSPEPLLRRPLGQGLDIQQSAPEAGSI
jgi:hypothetical protein